MTKQSISSIVTRTSLTIVSLVALQACGGPEQAEDVSTQHSAVSPQFIWDSGTQCSVGGVAMHCCPQGYAMVGARIDRNVFACNQLTVPTTGALRLDDGTQRNGMHSCLPNEVMVGLQAGLNKLACQAVSTAGIGYFEWYDYGPGLQDGFPMHVCSQGGREYWWMSGIRIDANNYNCLGPVTL